MQSISKYIVYSYSELIQNHFFPLSSLTLYPLHLLTCQGYLTPFSSLKGG